MSMKGTKATLLSTPLDVRLLNPAITTTIATDGILEHFILLADGEIRSTLQPIYGTDLSGLMDPWVSSPVVPPIYDEQTANTGMTGALGARGLVAVEVATTAITEYWTILFGTQPEFSLTGSVSMDQGTHTDLSADRTASDGDVTLPSAGWDGTPASGDLIYFATYDVPPLIVAISSRLACSLFMESKLGEEVPNRSDYMDLFRAFGTSKLDKLSRPDDKDGLHLPSVPSRDVSPIESQPAYNISELGEDLSIYADRQFD